MMKLSMVCVLLLLAAVNAKEELLPDAAIRSGVSSILVGLFAALVFVRALIDRQIAFRGVAVSWIQHRKLFPAALIGMFLVAAVFLGAGVLLLF